MTSHFLSSRWGHSLRAICSFADVWALICRLLGLWSPVVSVVAAGIWLKRAGVPSMFTCGFVAVRIFGQASRQVFGQQLVCSRRPILSVLTVAAHPPRKLKLRFISLRRMP
mgnify:CR=1 FL=1